MRNIVALIIILVLCLGLCSCGSMSSKPDSGIEQGTAVEDNNPVDMQTAPVLEEEPSVQIASAFRDGEFAVVCFNISPISREEAQDVISMQPENIIYAVLSNVDKLSDEQLAKEVQPGKRADRRYPVMPPMQENENLQAQETREELLEKYYDTGAQSLTLEVKCLLSNDAVDWNKPIYLYVRMVEFASLTTAMEETIEGYWERYDPVCVRNFGTTSLLLSNTEVKDYISS